MTTSIERHLSSKSLVFDDVGESDYLMHWYTVALYDRAI